MREFKSFADFAVFLRGRAAEIEHAKPIGLEAGARIIEDEAKRVIGTYDAGWPNLAASTQADRTRKGFPADEPELRTGAMRDSIKHAVRGNEAHIGSDSQVAAWQEQGTSKMPPRPFLGHAVTAKGKVAAETVGKAVLAPLAKG